MRKVLLFTSIVLVVFSGVAFADFVDNGDDMVTDTTTGLMWQQVTGGNMNWEAALSYCENLTLADYTDWRLPNIKELQSIVNYGTYNPAIDTSFFPNTVSSGYWSSTTYAYITVRAWRVSFLGGGVSSSYYKSANSCYVRAVRGGQ